MTSHRPDGMKPELADWNRLLNRNPLRGREAGGGERRKQTLFPRSLDIIRKELGDPSLEMIPRNSTVAPEKKHDVTAEPQWEKQGAEGQTHSVMGGGVFVGAPDWNECVTSQNVLCVCLV